MTLYDLLSDIFMLEAIYVILCSLLVFVCILVKGEKYASVALPKESLNK